MIDSILSFVKTGFIVLGIFTGAIIIITIIAQYKTRHIRRAMREITSKLDVQILRTYQFENVWFCLVYDEYSGQTMEITLFDERDSLNVYDDFVDGLFKDEK